MGKGSGKEAQQKAGLWGSSGIGNTGCLTGPAHWVSLEHVGSKSEKQLLVPLNRNRAAAVLHRNTWIYSLDSRLNKRGFGLGHVNTRHS